MSSKIQTKEKKIKLIILVSLAIGLLGLPIYYFIVGKQKYQSEVKLALKGVVTAKYRVQENNPKAVYVMINDSVTYYLPFSLINEINIGDTIHKESGNDYYIFRTITKLITMRLSKPNIFNYPKNWQGTIDINPR